VRDRLVAWHPEAAHQRPGTLDGHLDGQGLGSAHPSSLRVTR
jgi:hypothetical protein